MHEERWREIVAEVHSDIPRLVEDFLTAFTAAGRYGDSLVSEDELRLTAFEVFARITEVLVGAMDMSELRTHAQNLGRRRAQQGAKNSDLEMGIPGDLVALYTDATMATSAALFASGARNQSHDRRGRTVVRVSAPTNSPHRLDLGDDAPEFLFDIGDAVGAAGSAAFRLLRRRVHHAGAGRPVR